MADEPETVLAEYVTEALVSPTEGGGPERVKIRATLVAGPMVDHPEAEAGTELLCGSPDDYRHIADQLTWAAQNLLGTVEETVAQFPGVLKRRSADT